MTGNQDGDRVGATCAANSANGFAVPDFIGHLAIAQRSAAGDILQHSPDALLKIGAGG